MAQINQYPIEALNLNDNDLFDIDKEGGPGLYDSQKVKWGTIKTELSALGFDSNLGNSNLTQTDPVRDYSADDQIFRVVDLKRKQERIFPAVAAADIWQVQRSPRPEDVLPFPPVRNQGFFSFVYGLNRNLVGYDDGTIQMEQGNFWVGDNSIPTAAVFGQQMNPGALAIFASTNKPSVFTDNYFADTPTLNDQSAVAWFRSNSKGVRFPVLTETERNAIALPDLGLVIFNVSALKMQVYTGIGMSGWSNMN